MRDSPYRSSYALVINTGGTTVIGVVYWAAAAHLYTRQEVGRGSALVAALVLLSNFAQLNMVNTLPRFIPVAGRSAGRLIAGSYAASAAGALGGSLVFLTVLPRLSANWHFLDASPPVALAFIAGTVAWGTFSIQDAALLSLGRPAMVPAENFVYGAAKLLVLFLIASSARSGGIIFSWIIPLAVTVPGVNWLIFRHYLKTRTRPALTGTLRPGEIVRYASVDYVGSIMSQAYGNLLPLLVLSALGPAASGAFYISWTIAGGLGLVAGNFSAALLVEGAAAPDRLPDLTRGILARCLAVITSGALVLFFSAHFILGFYGTGYADHAALLLGLLALGTVPYSVVMVSFSLDRIAGRVGRAAFARLCLAVLVLGGSGILVRRTGIDGVGFAWSGGNTIVGLARCRMLARFLTRRPATPARAVTAEL